MRGLLSYLALFVLCWPLTAQASQTYAAQPTTGTLPGLTLVQNENANEDALLTNFLGTSAPSTSEAGMFWVDSANLELKFNDGTQYEPIGFYSTTTGNFSSSVLRIANAGSTGTTVNKLAKLTGAPSTAVVTATTDTGGAIGVVMSGAGTTGSTHIVLEDYASCVFDGATTAGDYVQISSSTSGDCHDAGSTYPTTGQILGRVVTTNGGGGTYTIFLFGGEIRGSSGGGGGSGTVTSVATNNGLTGGTITTSGTIGFASIANNAALCNNSGGSAVPTTANCTVTGTGNLVLATSPTLTTPVLGVASATSLAASGLGTFGTVDIGSTAAATSGAVLDMIHANTSMILPTGTSAQRPTPTAGMIRYNTSVPQVEAYYSGTWNALNGSGGGVSLSGNNTWTAGQAVTPDTATTCGTQSAGGTMTPDFSVSNSCVATFGAGNLTIANPVNVIAGEVYLIALSQDAVGGRTATWGTHFKWSGATAPTLSSSASAKDIISCWSDTTTTLECTLAIVNAH